MEPGRSGRGSTLLLGCRALNVGVVSFVPCGEFFVNKREIGPRGGMLPELFQQRRLHMRYQNFLPFPNELGIIEPAENFPRALHGKGVAVVPQEFHDCLGR